MAMLHVKVAARWASGSSVFNRVAILLAMSVTDETGVAVDGLTQDAIHVGYQFQPEASEDSLAIVSDFHHNGPTFGGNGWYSCIVNPQPGPGWLQDEVFLCVTVRHSASSGRGQDLVLARYHQL